MPAKRKKPRNGIALDLRTPKYRKRVIEDKRRNRDKARDKRALLRQSQGLED